MRIKMVQHYCGYLNDNQDWWPDEEKDTSSETAQELIERKYAIAVETKAAQAAAQMTETIKTHRKK